MNARGTGTLAAFVVALCCASAASAQTTTTADLTLQDSLRALTQPVGGAAIGEAIGLATALEVGTAPSGTSAGGFVFKLDPNTGLQARSATTFGPSFAERALTSGEGKISVNANFISATYTKLGTIGLGDMNMASVKIGSDVLSGHGSFVVTSKTLAVTGTIGVTDDLDLAVSVPLVSVKLDGVTWLQYDNRTNAQGTPAVSLYAKGGGIASGLGDIGAILKYRLLKFGEGQPDPGGIALIGVMRLPTGDRENLRGLGITRTQGGVVYSSGRGRLRPHASVGYEFWSDAIDVATFTSTGESTTVSVKDQLQFGAGLEVEATPKLTLLVDFLGRDIRGGGKVDYSSIQSGGLAANFPVVLPQGVRKLAVAPGLKLNLKGKLLLSLSGLFSLSDNGLHARFTPVVGFDLSL